MLCKTHTIINKYLYAVISYDGKVIVQPHDLSRPQKNITT